MLRMILKHGNADIRTGPTPVMIFDVRSCISQAHSCIYKLIWQNHLHMLSRSAMVYRDCDRQAIITAVLQLV